MNTNNITTVLSKYFTEKQIEALKDAWKYGSWGDCEIRFGNDDEDSWALGACTNDIKRGGRFTGRQISGIVSGISKVNNNLVECISDWWGDGSGDMVFFNYGLLGYDNSSDAWKAFNEWSNS